jgi:hypothetical protein
MLLGTLHPAVRLVVGVVVVVIGVVMQKVFLDAAGAVVILLSAVQWLSRVRRAAGRGRWGPGR